VLGITRGAADIEAGSVYSLGNNTKQAERTERDALGPLWALPRSRRSTEIMKGFPWYIAGVLIHQGQPSCSTQSSILAIS